ncbi:MAG: ATP-binding protein [Clostridia bacterium]|nr:ATP-binding protein [Clostridia bacterium]
MINFKINRKIEIYSADELKMGDSTIQDEDEKSIYISFPIGLKGKMRLKPKEMIRAMYYSENKKLYEFVTQVEDNNIENGMQLIKLNKPKNYEAIEGRKFARIPIMLNIRFVELDEKLGFDHIGPDELKKLCQSKKWMKGYAYDISAGGFGAVIQESLEHGKQIFCLIDDEYFDTGFIGKVVRSVQKNQSGKKLYKIGVQFSDLDYTSEQKLVRYIDSKRLTGPIEELSNIAKSIANLDFSKRLILEKKVEIGILGDSINLISDELQEVMDDLIEANIALKKAIEQKKQIDEMRKSFISSISHELKSPIVIKRSYAEGLKYNIVNDQQEKVRYCDILIDEVEKMDKIVKQLLSLSDLESETFELEQSIFNISVLIDDVIEKFDPILNEKNIETKVITNENYMVNADYLMIEQVISNYLTNAINHIDEDKYIEVSVQAVGEKVRVSVINSGENIPEEDLKNIWESFYKVDKARSREYGGTGLGLSIVKSIMEHHQEKYSVVNRKFGVEFWFELNLINKEYFSKNSNLKFLGDYFSQD